MTKLRILDLFSGIGGFSLGLERTGGFETVAFCEIEPFPRRVLAKHWPGVPIYEDVTKLTGDILARDGIAVDVVTGGFPCQDLSVAGKQRGMGEGTRSGLWSEIIRLVGELRPRYVIVENVAALLAGPSERRGGWFGRVLGDLAECGYDAEWENIPAAALGAPHRRERVWLVAYPACKQNRGVFLSGLEPDVIAIAAADTNEVRCKGGTQQPIQGQQYVPAQSLRNATEWISGWPLSASRVCHAHDGIPSRVDRLTALGNAVVPQIPEIIGRAILAAEASS